MSENNQESVDEHPGEVQSLSKENSVDEEDEEDDALYQITKKQRLSLKLNDDTIGAIRDVFRVLDKDESGTLDQSELGNAMKSMGVECGEREIEELMKQIDKDGNGTLDFFEFSQMVSTKMREYDPEKELKEAFAVFDINGDGQISVDELKVVVESLGGSMTTEELENMLLEADDNSDGFLDYAEFVRIWMGDDVTIKTSEDEVSSTDTKANEEEFDKEVANADCLESLTVDSSHS